MNGEKLKNKAK